MSPGSRVRHQHFYRVLPVLAIAAGWLGVTHTLPAQDWVRTSAPSQFWSGLACSANGAVLIASSRYADANFNPGGIYLSTNSGRSWQLTSAPIQFWGPVVCSADGTRLAAIGASTMAFPPNAQIYSSTNGGSTWEASSAPAESWVALTGSADGSRLVAAIDEGPVYFSTNAGATWAQSDAPGYYWQGLASSADGQKLALSGGDPVNVNLRTVFLSTNAGANWTAVPGAPTAMQALSTSADGTQWFGAAGNIGVYRSADSGQTWALTSAPAQEWLAIACSADGSKAMTVAITPSGQTYLPGPVYASADYGKSWAQSGTLTGYFNSVVCSTDGAKWAVAEGGYAAGYIYTLQTPPRLAIQAVAGGLQLSWPASATGFALQQTAALPAQNSWLSTTNSVQLSDDEFKVFLPNPAGNRFYRLAAP